MNQHVTILRKHVNRYVSEDGCTSPGHGIGIGICRIHQLERYLPKHRSEGPTSTGSVRTLPRIYSL